MSEEVNLYYFIERGTVSDANWNALIALVDTIETRGIRAKDKNVKSASLDGNIIYYEGRFPLSAISFDKFAAKLSTAFNVDIANIEIITSLTEFGFKGDFLYGGTLRFSITLLGCSENNICSWEVGAATCRQYRHAKLAAWETANV